MPPARERGVRWFEHIERIQIGLCRSSNYVRVRAMRQDLQKDMQRLKTERAIDDSLIESLLASKSQANAHLNF
jgi:hypothetical protein